MVSLTDHNSPLKALVDVHCVCDDDEALVFLTNAVERQIAELDISTLRSSVGEFPVVFSRNKRHDFPHGDYTGKITRLLDSPLVTKSLISLTTEHYQSKLKKLLKEHPTHTVSRAQLPHTINIKKHRQSATLLSYMMRTFCPARTPALFPDPEQHIREEHIERIILSLPIDPAKVSDEVIKKMGLAPEDYDTYTAQARLRYKLWIRPRFLAILARAHVFERDPTLNAPGKTTARLISFQTESGERKVATFGTTTDMYDHITGIEAPRHHRRKTSGTSFRIFSNFSALLRSQEHALIKLYQKWQEVSEFLELLSHQSSNKSWDIDQQILFTDAQKYFSQHHGFHEKKISEFLQKIEENPFIILHITRVLRQLLDDIRGKGREIDTTYKLLLGKWDTIRGPKG